MVLVLACLYSVMAHTISYAIYCVFNNFASSVNLNDSLFKSVSNPIPKRRTTVKMLRAATK